MALLGGQRDIAMFRGMNRELLRRWIDISIDWYKINLNSTDVDIYGEAEDRSYYQPVRLYCYIERNDQEYVTDEMATDVNQQLIFSFLQDDLKDLQHLPEVGDLIHWNEKYWEIDTLVSNQLIGGKTAETNKPSATDTNESIKTFGSDWSYQVQAHMSRLSRITIEPYHFGTNE